MPYHGYCCLKNCKNTWRNSEVKFYKFPEAKYKLDQRFKWIGAIRKSNVSGPEWTPKSSDRICSDHFFGKLKSNNPLSPSYIPSIFSLPCAECKKNQDFRLPRCKKQTKCLAKKVKSEVSLLKNPNVQDSINFKQNQSTSEDNDFQYALDVDLITDGSNESSSADHNFDYNEFYNADVKECKSYSEDGCQANIIGEEYNKSHENTFICNRYIFLLSSDAEVQTDINVSTVYGTLNKIFVDKATETDDNETFQGIL